MKNPSKYVHSKTLCERQFSFIVPHDILIIFSMNKMVLVYFVLLDFIKFLLFFFFIICNAKFILKLVIYRSLSAISIKDTLLFYNRKISFCTSTKFVFLAYLTITCKPLPYFILRMFNILWGLLIILLSMFKIVWCIFKIFTKSAIAIGYQLQKNKLYFKETKDIFFIFISLCSPHPLSRRMWFKQYKSTLP